MGIGPRSPEPDLLLVCVCVCVCVGTGELISFPSGSLCLPCKGSAKGWRGLADASKLAVLGGLEGGAPHTVQPPREKKKSGRREPAKVSCQAVPAPRSPAPHQGEPGQLRCRPLTLHSARQLSQEAEGAACGLHHPLLPARPLRSRPWDRRAS